MFLIGYSRIHSGSHFLQPMFVDAGVSTKPKKITKVECQTWRGEVDFMIHAAPWSDSSWTASSNITQNAAPMSIIGQKDELNSGRKNGLCFAGTFFQDAKIDPSKSIPTINSLQWFLERTYKMPKIKSWWSKWSSAHRNPDQNSPNQSPPRWSPRTSDPKFCPPDPCSAPSAPRNAACLFLGVDTKRPKKKRI